jgi:hypothetical protein
MILSCVVTYYQNSIADAWKFLIAIGAGTGSVLILRWFWWRINAWSEVSAMAASLIVSVFLQLQFKMDGDDPRLVLITVACSTLIWLTATFMTAPEDEAVLLSFYRRVRPSASLWRPIAQKAVDVPAQHDGGCNLFNWICGCLLVYLTLFGVGKLIFGQRMLGTGLLILAALAGWAIYRDLNRRGWKSITD